MAENEGVGVTPNAEIKENGPESPSIVSSSSHNGPVSSPAVINNNTGSSQQLSGPNSILSGASSGLTSEQRRKLINEAEQQRTEQRRLQLLESQRRAEEQREKLREERKRRIEETKKREEARQKKALETKKELERQYKDHLLMSQRGSSAANSNHSRQMPPIMRASHIATTRSHTTGPSSTGDRMTTSFTVAFGSSAPRSICTKTNEAVLRSQAAFEARLASYLSGRHSGCFLTKSSTYTTYALYVKPDLLPEDHPIRRYHLDIYQHNPDSPRRAISANPALRITQKSASSSGVVGDRSRALSTTRQPSQQQQQHRSRPMARLPVPAAGAGESGHPAPMRRAMSSQHFAEPTIAYSSKVRGAPPPDISRKASADETMPKRRVVPGRSTIPRDRCYSYAAPTTAWTNRQRANSQDRKPTGQASEDRMTTSVMNLPRRKPSASEVGGAGGETRGRSKLLDQPPQKTQPTVYPALTKTAPTKPATAKKVVKPHANEPVKTNTAATAEAPVGIKKPVKPIGQPPSSSKSASPSAASPTVESESAKSVSPPPSGSSETAELQDVKQEPSPAIVHQPSPPPSLAAELDLAANPPPPPPETPPPEPSVEPATEEEDVEKAPKEPIHSAETMETIIKENDDVVEERTPSESDQAEEKGLSKPKTEEHQEPETENGHGGRVHRSDSLEEIKTEPMADEEEPELPPAVQQKVEDATSQKLAAHLPSGPLKASTTGSGEGGCLSEEEAAIYRAKMAEQRRLAKERLAEQQRRDAEAEKERKEKREAERQAAIEAAREKAVEEARAAAEARMAREAAVEEARLLAERKAQERADKERQTIEALMRERSERARKSEEEREMRRKRLESIMSRVNRSDHLLGRTVPISASSNSLTGSTTAASGNATDEETGGPSAAPAVQFSLGPNNMDSSNVFHAANGESGALPSYRNQQNGFSEAPRTTTFNSPLLASLFSGGGLGTNSRLAGGLTDSASAMATSDNVVPTSNENMHSEEAQQPPPSKTNLSMGRVGNASSS